MTNPPTRLGATITVLGLALVGVTAPAGAVPAPFPGDPDVKIESMWFKGTGCHRDDTSVALSNGNRAIDVRHSRYTVNAGLVPQADGTSKWVGAESGHCQINLKLSYPPGLTFALTSATARRFADLAGGAKVKQITTYSFGESIETGRLVSDLTGPMAEVHSQIEQIRTRYWSECGKTSSILLSTNVRVDARESARDTSSRVSLDARLVGDQQYRFQWRTC
ncbi:hypothetical protein GCM10010124_40500 [Pilimelia terevasa]|uniref:DUF4360 domain-containing protein n=1 Tax=Pilimelia terevasa TaxID=53372 RepID=A0A8J3FLJ2_9ACTN|nr:DUF4360 domain-containing protein [Pilimelia terevasa]GGK43612.1 hypothetical protein GCM10010124_40500 [Pilimelia terevasa]